MFNIIEEKDITWKLKRGNQPKKPNNHLKILKSIYICVRAVPVFNFKETAFHSSFF